jgi:hypothetical protein
VSFAGGVTWQRSDAQSARWHRSLQTRTVFPFGVGACIVLVLLTPALADTVGDCKWASDDPRAVIDACTTLI